MASVPLAAPDAAARLREVVAASPKVRGVRWILNYDGPFDGLSENATWPRVVASPVTDPKDAVAATDFLCDPAAAGRFEEGFRLLAEHGLSFDLQCNPRQLSAAAALFARHPSVPVVIDHLGTPLLIADDGGEPGGGAGLVEWREGLAAVAALPQVHIKLSMLGYAVRGWSEDAARENFLRARVREVIALFGARRCMFASNWHVDAAVSNFGAAGPSMPELYAHFQSWVADLPASEQERLFAGTAEEFYRI